MVGLVVLGLGVLGGLGVVGLIVVVLPLIVDAFTVHVDPFTDEALIVLGFGETLVMVDLIVLCLPFCEVILTSVITLDTGDFGYTSVTSDVTEVALTVGEVGVITVVTVVVTGPANILLVIEFQKPCCVLVIVKVVAGCVTVTGTVVVTIPADVLDDGDPG